MVLTAGSGTGGFALLRNLAGLTGIALLAAASLGAHLSWVPPLGYVLFCGGELDLHVSSLLTWPTLPTSNHAATAIATALLAAGLAAVCLLGAYDRRTEHS